MTKVVKSPCFFSSGELLCQFLSQRSSLLAQLWSPCCPIMFLSVVGLYLSTQSRHCSLLPLRLPCVSLTSRPLGHALASFTAFIGLFFRGVNLLFFVSDSLIGLIFLFPWSFLGGVRSNLDFSFFICRGNQKGLMKHRRLLSCRTLPRGKLTQLSDLLHLGCCHNGPSVSAVTTFQTSQALTPRKPTEPSFLK